MRAVLQRVTRASVTVEDKTVGAIGVGLVVLLGIAHDDNESDVEYLVHKVTNLRIFDDEAGQMNLSLKDVDGGLLVISQFTLFGDVRHGRRPSYIQAARPEIAEPLYEKFIEVARTHVTQIASGSFGRMMQVELINEGPVTIMLDSRKLF